MTLFVRCDICGQEVVEASYKNMNISDRAVVDGQAVDRPALEFHLHNACWDKLVAWVGTQRTQPEPTTPEGAAAMTEEEPNG